MLTDEKLVGLEPGKLKFPNSNQAPTVNTSEATPVFVAAANVVVMAVFWIKHPRCDEVVGAAPNVAL